MKRKTFTRMLVLALVVISMVTMIALPASAYVNHTSTGYYCLEANETTAQTNKTGYSEANFGESSTSSVALKVETMVRGDGYILRNGIFYEKSHEDTFSESSFTAKYNMQHSGSRVFTTQTSMTQSAGELSKQILFVYPETTIVVINQVTGSDGWTTMHMAHWSPKTGDFLDAYRY